MAHNKTRLQKAAAVLFAVLLWQAAAMLLKPNLQFLLASPLQVLERLAVLCVEPGFWGPVWFTFIRIVGGFFLAFLLGTVLAVVAGRFRLCELFLWPFITAIKSVPVASFIVIALLLFSSDKLSVFIPFLMVLPIVYTNILEGLKNTDKKLLEMAALFRVPWHKRMRMIYFPGIRPYLRSACSVSLGLSWKAGVAAEIIGIPDGSIGEKFYEAKAYFLMPDLLAWTVVVVVVSVLFEKLFLKLLDLAFQRMERGGRV
jgi:NitT/TauT family transport system permease protein